MVLIDDGFPPLVIRHLPFCERLQKIGRSFSNENYERANEY